MFTEFEIVDLGARNPNQKRTSLIPREGNRVLGGLHTEVIQTESG